jgi:hypothetical protein
MPMPLPIRPILQVSCQVHRPFQSPSPVDEHPKAIPALPLHGGRPVPPVKPPGLSARSVASATVQRVVDSAVTSEIETCSDEVVELAKTAVAMLPTGRPVPPVKPPGLFAKLTGLQPVSDSADESMESSDDDDDDDEMVSRAVSAAANWVKNTIQDIVAGDDGEIEWDDECDEDDDDFYEEEQENVADEVCQTHESGVPISCAMGNLLLLPVKGDRSSYRRF